jgi:hypothetical protein
MNVEQEICRIQAGLPVTRPRRSTSIILHRWLHNGIMYGELLKLFVEQIPNFLVDLDLRNMNHVGLYIHSTIRLHGLVFN